MRLAQPPSNSGAVSLEFELREQERDVAVATLAATGPFAEQVEPLVAPEYQNAATTEGLDLRPRLPPSPWRRAT